MNQQTYQSLNSNFKNQLSFTRNNIENYPQQPQNVETYGQNVQHINNCDTFLRINQQYLQLRNKVQDRIKLLENKCQQDNNLSFSNKNNRSNMYDNMNIGRQRYPQHPQFENDRERTHSFVYTTNPSNINNLINNQYSQNLMSQNKNQYISYGQKQKYQKVGYFPPNTPTHPLQPYHHPYSNLYQNGNQRAPCLHCQSNPRMFYSHGISGHSNKVNSSSSVYTCPHTNTDHTQQPNINHPQQIPTYGFNFPQQTIIKGLNYPSSPSQLAESINASNNGTINTVNTSNINDVMLENIKEQKQINMNLKALSEKLSNFSGRRSDQNDFYKESNNFTRKQGNQQNFREPRFRGRQITNQNQYSGNSQERHRQRAYHSTNSHQNNIKIGNKTNRGHICNKNQPQNFNQYQGYQNPYLYQHGRIENIYYQSNNKSRTNRFGHQPKIKRKNSKRQLNQVLSFNDNRQRRPKINERIVFPTYRLDIQKNSSKASNSIQGRAKSASLNTLSTSERNKKLYTFKGIKQPEVSPKKHIKRKNGDNNRQKKRQLDPDYFAQKSQDFSSKNITNQHYRSPNYENTYQYNAHCYPYNNHSTQTINHLNHPHYPHNFHQINTNYPQNPLNYHQPVYCNSQKFHGISPEDQVFQMYQNRKHRKNKQVYKDSQHRNKKHQKEHMLQSFIQQEKLRKELIQKISKNFFNKHGVK